MTPVLHYVPRWLPPSEQFVHQVVSRTRRPAVVAVRRGLVGAEAFPQRPLLRVDRWLRVAPASQERRAVALALAAALKRHRAVLLHVHFGREVEGVVGAAQRAGVPLVVSVHGSDVTSTAQRSSPALRHALQHAAAVLVPSDFLTGPAVEAGARADRIRVLPSGVDRELFVPQPWPEGPPTVVFVGRFVEKKGLDVLAAAWPGISSAVPEARLLVLGEGPVPVPPGAERWWPDVVRRGEQVRDALRRATVVVTPSRTAADGDAESLLLVNLEAQAVGRPVVSTQHGGIPSAVAPSTAVLVPENDSDALRDAVVMLLRDPARARAMGAAGPVVAARFDAGACARDVDALYEELLS